MLYNDFMKSIAIISHNDHTRLGGIPTYNRNLINFLSKKYTVVDFPIDPSDENQKIASQICPINERLRQSKKGPYHLSTLRKMKKFLKEDEYDVYILSARYYSRKILKNKKVILVQHENEKTYTGLNMPVGEKIKRVFDTIIGMGTLRNPFNIANDTFKFYVKNEPSAIPPGLPGKKSNYKRDGWLWAGRFVKTKGIAEAVRISEKRDVRFFGRGELENLIPKKLNQGSYTPNDLKKIFGSARGFMMTSKNEGSETTVAEALSVGTPVVMFSDSTAINDFYSRCPGVFITKSRDVDEFLNLMDVIDSLSDKDYDNLSKDIVNWYSEWCSPEKFEQEWKKKIKKYL